MDRNSGRNPVLPPDVYIPDGEAHVFGNCLYVYGSRDSEKEEYCSGQYQVVSTSDMKEWTVHDTSFDGNQVPWIKDKKRRHYPVVDMDLKDPTPMFQNFVKKLPAFIRWWLKLTRKSNLNLGKVMPNAQCLYAPDCIEKNGRYYLYF